MIRIRAGASWKQDPDVRRALRGGAGGRPDAEIVDVLGIEVDGVDIAGGHTEGAVFASMRSLVEAVGKLVRGEPQASVNFQDGAVELVLRRRGPSALLSLVALSRPSRVLVRDVEVELGALADAARDGASALVSDLAELGPAAADAPFARALRKAAAGLARKARPARETPAPAKERAHRPRRRPDAPSCGFELRDDEGLIESYRPGGPDLGSLLAPGRVALHGPHGEEIFGVAGAPFLVLRDLAAAAERVAIAAAEGEPRCAVAIADGRGRRATLSLDVDLAAQAVSVDGGEPVGCAPLLLSRALLEAAVDFCGAVVARNARQAENAYLAALHASASERLAHVRELLSGDVTNERGLSAKARRPKRTVQAPLGPGRVRRLAFRAGWRAEVGPALGLWRAGEVAVASGGAATLGLDARTGAVRWQAPGAGSALLAGKALLLCAEGRLACLDPRTGRARWARPWPALPLPRFAFAFGGGPLVLVTPAALVAVDASTGRPAWRFEPPSAHGLAAAGFGALAVAGGDSGLLYGVDAAGAVRWRVTLPGPLAAPPSPFGELCLALARTARGAAAVALDPATGRRAWLRELDLAPSGPALAFAGLAAVPGLAAGEGAIAALAPDGSLAFAVAPPFGPGAPSLAALPSGLVAKSSAGGCAAVDRAGEVRWLREPACDAAPGNVPPTVARSVVLVPGESVVALDGATGAELGRAPLEAPAYLVADDDMALYALDADGAVRAARLATHLSVI